MGLIPLTECPLKFRNPSYPNASAKRAPLRGQGVSGTQIHGGQGFWIPIYNCGNDNAAKG